jgi:hypothetical protein
MGTKAIAPHLLRIPEVLAALQFTKDETHLHLVVNKGGTEETVDLAARPYADLTDPTSMCRLGFRSNNPIPLYHEHPDNPYWFKFLPDRRLLYFQFNAIVDKPQETLAAFFQRLFDFIGQNPVEYLVVDLRENGGGNNYLIRPLVRGLIKNQNVDRPGCLFTIVGRNTFSAAMNTATTLERETNAIFVGEPTGSGPNHVGEGKLIRLPCTGTRITCSSQLWQDSDPRDHRVWIAPALVAIPNVADEAVNIDPAMAVIDAYLHPAPRSSPTMPPLSRSDDSRLNRRHGP